MPDPVQLTPRQKRHYWIQTFVGVALMCGALIVRTSPDFAGYFGYILATGGWFAAYALMNLYYR